MVLDKPDVWANIKLDFIRAAIINNSKQVQTYKKKSYLPRRCYYSNKKLFLKPAVKVVRRVPLTAGKITEVYWIDAKEYLLLTLRYSK